MSDLDSVYPEGAVVCFRTLTPENLLARHVMPSCRLIELDPDTDCWIAKDEEGTHLGAFSCGFVAAIIPLKTVGPADASNQPK